MQGKMQLLYLADTCHFRCLLRYGRTGIYKTYMFGCPSIIVCIPKTCRKVLTDDERFKLGYPKATTILTGRRSFHGISNAEHKRLRRLTTSPINGHEALAGYINLIEGIVINSLEKWAGTKRPIELLTELRKVAFKVITNIFISTHSESVISSVENLYSDLNAGIKSQAINLPGFAFHRALKARKKLVKVFQTVLDKKRAIIKKNSDRTDVKKDMMDLLLGVKDEDGRQLEDEDIIDLLIVFMLAGHESSAHGALWAVIYLSQNPEFFTKAKEEQQEIVKRRLHTQKGLTLTEIRQMEYLYKVIDETLRRTSISFSVFRQAKEDVNLNGYLIPKGWKVLVWNRAVHMDPENYSNPKDFDPSRWDNFTPKAGTFLPFGAGSRFCPGSDLAKLEIAIFLHHYLLNYIVERLNPDCPVKWLPIARPVDMCVARIIKVT
ncbi:beta-amyrin 11-oxidase-like isoform X2 [Alnus glutinosa]|uniref:beta-amyrin 11-oxidase-like isoform X2 n=1 Tax=Alnus glutinosa TaxID=3517 RepID=UPI002D789033|nr:beta-amyrin 11-oxidase-like isoform X2 [Alnus glutinosa]